MTEPDHVAGDDQNQIDISYKVNQLEIAVNYINSTISILIDRIEELERKNQ